jgi:hypothetical protein
MPARPRRGEREQHFISRCIEWMNKHEQEKPEKQRKAICYQMWEDRNKKKGD